MVSGNPFQMAFHKEMSFPANTTLLSLFLACVPPLPPSLLLFHAEVYMNTWLFCALFLAVVPTAMDHHTLFPSFHEEWQRMGCKMIGMLVR